MILLKALAGSRLYGTNRPDSDFDFRGIMFEPKESLIGLAPPFEQQQLMVTHDDTGETDDITYYALRKFLRLAIDNNPNIIDLLFTPRTHAEIWTDTWQVIHDMRHEFLTQRLRHTYAGYAHSQLHRIQQHRRWIENPPEEPGPNVKRGPNDDWTKYQEWKTNRNPARHELEMKYAYDTKHASHLIRLLLQACTLLSGQQFSPVLDGWHLDYVLDVLHGQVPYDDLLSFSEDVFEIVKNVESPLPHKPVIIKKLEPIVMNLYKDYLNRE